MTNDAYNCKIGRQAKPVTPALNLRMAMESMDKRHPAYVLVAAALAALCSEDAPMVDAEGREVRDDR